MMGRKEFGVHGLALSLLVFSLLGCAHSSTLATNAIPPSQGHGEKQRPVRTIISFQSPTVDNVQLSAAISEACHCQPVFLRSYLGNALIYEIALPQDHAFAAFEVELTRHAARHGIKAIEQDSIMQNQ